VCARIDGGFDGQDAAGHDGVEGAKHKQGNNLQVINNNLQAADQCFPLLRVCCDRG
jgi:hypothetical protein